MSLSWLYCHKFVRLVLLRLSRNLCLCLNKTKNWCVRYGLSQQQPEVLLFSALLSLFIVGFYFCLYLQTHFCVICVLWMVSLWIVCSESIVMCACFGGNSARFHVILDNGSIVARKWQQQKMYSLRFIDVQLRPFNSRGEIFNERKTPRIKLLVTKQQKMEDDWRLCDVIFSPLHKCLSVFRLESTRNAINVIITFRLLFASFEQPSKLI